MAMDHCETPLRIEAFEYPQSSWEPTSLWRDIPKLETGDSGTTPASSEAVIEEGADLAVEASTPNAVAVKRSIEAARLKGIEEGRQAASAVFDERLKKIETTHIERVTRMAERMDQDRAQFFQTIEPEVVKLALSIAERVLRRELQLDPLLLTGAVRVALGQIADEFSVRLRVPQRDLQLWSETIEHLPGLRTRPEVIGDTNLETGDAFLEGEMGSAELGVRSQLSEIARSFFEDSDSAANQVQAGTDPSTGQR